MLGNEIHGFGSPDLLYKKGSADAEFLKAGLEGLGVCFKKTVSYQIVLDYNEFPRVKARPFSTVLFKHLELLIELARLRRKIPLQIL
jgi:hypothetical protein